jgi:hypothetical protein
MAWLDNSPVMRAQPPKGGVIAEQGMKYIARKLSALAHLPLLKILIPYLQSLFVHKKLNAIEQKIQQHTFDHTQDVSRVLRQLFQIKKNYHHVLSISSPNRTKLAELKGEVLKKAQVALKPVPEMLNTHTQVMKLLANSQPVLEDTPPVRLHWRHADYHFVTIPPERSKLYPGTVFIHASLPMLLQLLQDPSTDLIQSSMDLRVSRQDLTEAASSNKQLVASVLLKYPVNFSANKSNSPQLGFWQPARDKLQPEITFNKSLLKHIQQLQFQSDEHQLQFKLLVHQSQDPELLSLFTILERQRQIYIMEQNPTLTLHPC